MQELPSALQLKPGQFHPNFYLIEEALRAYEFMLLNLPESEWSKHQLYLLRLAIEWYAMSLYGEKSVQPIFASIREVILEALHFYLNQYSCLASFCQELETKRLYIINAGRILKTETWVRHLPVMIIDEETVPEEIAAEK